MNLAVVNFSFDFHIRANVLQILLIGAALLLYKKIR